MDELKHLVENPLIGMARAVVIDIGDIGQELDVRCRMLAAAKVCAGWWRFNRVATTNSQPNRQQYQVKPSPLHATDFK